MKTTGTGPPFFQTTKFFYRIFQLLFSVNLYITSDIIVKKNAHLCIKQTFKKQDVCQMVFKGLFEAEIVVY